MQFVAAIFSKGHTSEKITRVTMKGMDFHCHCCYLLLYWSFSDLNKYGNIAKNMLPIYRPALYKIVIERNFLF